MRVSVISKIIVVFAMLITMINVVTRLWLKIIFRLNQLNCCRNVLDNVYRIVEGMKRCPHREDKTSAGISNRLKDLVDLLLHHVLPVQTNIFMSVKK